MARPCAHPRSGRASAPQVSSRPSRPYYNVTRSSAGRALRPARIREALMRYLHTMLRVRDLDAALDFYCNKLGMKETRRRGDDKNRYTLVFLAGPLDEKLLETSKTAGRPGPELELTYNWDTEDYGEARHFGHLAF